MVRYFIAVKKFVQALNKLKSGPNDVINRFRLVAINKQQP